MSPVFNPTGTGTERQPFFPVAEFIIQHITAYDQGNVACPCPRYSAGVIGKRWACVMDVKRSVQPFPGATYACLDDARRDSAPAFPETRPGSHAHKSRIPGRVTRCLRQGTRPARRYAAGRVDGHLDHVFELTILYDSTGNLCSPILSEYTTRNWTCVNSIVPRSIDRGTMHVSVQLQKRNMLWAALFLRGSKA